MNVQESHVVMAHNVLTKWIRINVFVKLVTKESTVRQVSRRRIFRENIYQLLDEVDLLATGKSR